MDDGKVKGPMQFEKLKDFYSSHIYHNRKKIKIKKSSPCFSQITMVSISHFKLKKQYQCLPMTKILFIDKNIFYKIIKILKII
jgi:hypothetical protein